MSLALPSFVSIANVVCAIIALKARIVVTRQFLRITVRKSFSPRSLYSDFMSMNLRITTPIKLSVVSLLAALPMTAFAGPQAATQRSSVLKLIQPLFPATLQKTKLGVTQRKEVFALLQSENAGQTLFYSLTGRKPATWV